MIDGRRQSDQRFYKTRASALYLLLTAFCLAGGWSQSAFAQVGTRPAGTVTPWALQRALEAERAETRRLQTELDQTKAQLATERGRTEALQKEVDRLEKLLSGRARSPAERSAGGSADRPAVGSNVAVVFVEFPARKTNAMGQVQSTETKLADPVPGAKQLRIVPSGDADELHAISLEADPAGGTVQIICLLPEQGKVTVASLVLKTAGLFWAWNNFRAGAGMAPALEHLEDTLRCSMIELRGERGVVARMQFSPLELEIKLPTAAGRSPPVRLSKSAEDVRLQSDASGSGCKVESTGGNKLCFVFENTRIELTLDARTKVVTVEREISDSPEIRALDAKIRSLQQDTDDWRREKALSEARKDSSSDAHRTPSGGRTTSSDDRNKDSSARSLDARISAINKTLDSCKKEKARLRVAQMRQKPIDVSDCGAHLELPNGVILYRLKLKT